MAAGMVIVGAGECGGRAALGLREAGYHGPVILIGAEPHAPYERPPLSKELMCGPLGVPPRTIASAEKLRDLGIDFRAGQHVAGIDRNARQVVLDDGVIVPYEKLLLATGARPRRISLPGADSAHVVTLRTHDDAAAIRARLDRGRRVAVVGGGFIGLELAAAARQHGAEVVVLEALPRLLSRAVPAEIAARLEDRHRRDGVEVIFGASLAAMEEASGGVRLHLADRKSLAADVVVLGIGAAPDTALAQSAGLAIDNGVAVDDRLVTSDPAILAAGDCCSFPHVLYCGRRIRIESWRSAQEQGALAARNLLGAAEPVSAVPWFWSDQYELGLQIAGLPSFGPQTVRRENGANLVLFHLTDDGRLVGASGIGPGNAVARDIRLSEMLIARRARPDRDALSRPDVSLKSLLAL